MSNFGYVEFSLVVLYEGPRQIEDGTWMGAEFLVGPNGDGPPWEFTLKKRFDLPDQDTVDRLRERSVEPERLFRAGLLEKARSVILTLNLQQGVNGHYSIVSSSPGWSNRLPEGPHPVRITLGHRTSSLEHPRPLSELPDTPLQFDYYLIQYTEPVLKTMLELFDAAKSLRKKHARLALLNFFKVLEAKAWADKRAATSSDIADQKITTKNQDWLGVWQNYG